MACFIVPAAEAVISTAVTKVLKNKEIKCPEKFTAEKEGRLPFSSKLKWLNNMLWGGSALLAFEHVWHGELAAQFPFLTAVSEGHTQQMLAEMGTAGVAMSVIVTSVWALMVYVTSKIEKKEPAGEVSE